MLALVIGLASLLFAFLSRRSFATACAALWLIALAWFGGLLPALAVGLLAAAALGAGSVLV
ncbi:MAG: hypothetical protein LH470_10305, partial [Lysobacter sp.]|nr:hypothetical protein [Lysobacter sp.]